MPDEEAYDDGNEAGIGCDGAGAVSGGVLDPIRLLHEIRDAQAGLAAVMQHPGFPQPAIGTRADVDQFLTMLATAWRSGDVRPTHRKKHVAPHTWRTR